MLKALQDHRAVLAAEAARDGSFACPECATAVTLRRGRIVAAHFAHAAGAKCAWGAGETQWHMAAKLAMRDALAKRKVNADVEVIVPALPGDRRADVLAVSPGGRKLAFEFQHTSLTIDAIEQRTASYASEGIAQLWLPFIAEKPLTLAVWSADGRSGTIKGWCPPSYVLWVYDFHGDLWLLDDLAPNVPSLIMRIRSGYGPCRTGLQTRTA